MSHESIYLPGDIDCGDIHFCYRCLQDKFLHELYNLKFNGEEIPVCYDCLKEKDFYPNKKTND
jgi:hypothetical protein